FEITAEKHDSPCSQWVQHVTGEVAPWIEDPSPIAISELRRRSCLCECGQSLQHSPNCLIEPRRNRDLITDCQHSRVEKEVQRVDVITDRLFEVHTIGQDLTFSLPQHDLPPVPLPASGMGQFRTQRPGKEEGYSFT